MVPTSFHRKSADESPWATNRQDSHRLEDESGQLVESRRKVFGTDATFEDAGNGLYKITRCSEHDSTLQPDQQVKEYRNEGPGYTNKLEIVERDV